MLEGRLRFRFADGEADAPAGTTVFVPAGVAHAYSAVEPTRYLVILTPRMDALIDQLRRRTSSAGLAATLAEFDTVLGDETAGNLQSVAMKARP